MAKTYEAMQRRGNISSSGWQFLDLKSRKKTGDIEKKILQYRQKNKFQVFNFSAAKRKEGVSTILSNLISYFNLQHSEKQILVIDANFKSPSLHSNFNIDNASGLIDVLKNGKILDEVATNLGSTNISIVTTGQGFDPKADNLDQEKFNHLLKTNKSKYDFIFIDSPPILASSDALSAAVASDVTFWIIQSVAIQKDVAHKTKTLLLDNECIIGGVILNQVKQVIPEWIYRLT
jgi:Mrp family chromosome partitioning ATPase